MVAPFSLAPTKDSKKLLNNFLNLLKYSFCTTDTWTYENVHKLLLSSQDSHSPKEDWLLVWNRKLPVMPCLCLHLKPLVELGQHSEWNWSHKVIGACHGGKPWTGVAEMKGATESPIHLGHLVGNRQQQWSITALPQCSSQTYATLCGGKEQYFFQFQEDHTPSLPPKYRKRAVNPM